MIVKFLDGTEREIKDMRCANLSGANLRGTDLTGTNLSGAYLRGTNLSGTNLSGANLRGTDLRCTNLSGADMRGADMRGANLRGADMRGAIGLEQFRVAPEVGQFIAFKKVSGRVLTLMIPAQARRVNAYSSRKCRAEFAYVIAGGQEGLVAHGNFRYPVTGMVTPDAYDPDPRVECSHGIHFYMTRAEAEAY